MIIFKKKVKFEPHKIYSFLGLCFKLPKDQIWSSLRDD